MREITLEKYNELNKIPWATRRGYLHIPSVDRHLGTFWETDRSGLGLVGAWHMKEDSMSLLSVNGLVCLDYVEPPEQEDAVRRLQELVRKNTWLPSFKLMFSSVMGVSDARVQMSGYFFLKDLYWSNVECNENFRSLCVELDVGSNQVREFIEVVFSLPIKYGLYFYSPEKGLHLP